MRVGGRGAYGADFLDLVEARFGQCDVALHLAEEPHGLTGGQAHNTSDSVQTHNHQSEYSGVSTYLVPGGVQVDCTQLDDGGPHAVHVAHEHLLAQLQPLAVQLALLAEGMVRGVGVGLAK